MLGSRRSKASRQRTPQIFAFMPVMTSYTPRSQLIEMNSGRLELTKPNAQKNVYCLPPDGSSERMIVALKKNFENLSESQISPSFGFSQFISVRRSVMFNYLYLFVQCTIIFLLVRADFLMEVSSVYTFSLPVAYPSPTPVRMHPVPCSHLHPQYHHHSRAGGTTKLNRNVLEDAKASGHIWKCAPLSPTTAFLKSTDLVWFFFWIIDKTLISHVK